MNEPIMRRGLSPEGRRIRQKHQGTLLNDEFGVTSQPIHKKIEKDFLTENVMRLKEIQAKCRTQETRPISGNHPVKAIRPSSKELSYRDITYEDIIADEKDFKSNVREGSAHSDYFSLPDEAQNEREQSLPQSCPQSNITRNPPYEKFCSEAPSIASLDKFNENIKAPVKNNANQSSNCVNIITYSDNEEVGQRNTNFILKNKNSPPKFRESYPHSPQIRRNKINNIIEKIKSKQPACETNTEFIWRDIRKEHRTLFLNDECLSIGTPRTHLVSLKNIVPSTSKDSGFHKRSSVVRSHSLDRNAINRPKSVTLQDFNSTYTLEPRPKSSSTAKLINLKQDLHEVSSLASQDPFKYHNPRTVCQTESLPNLSDRSEETASNYKPQMEFVRSQLSDSSSAAAAFSHSTYTINDMHNCKNIENKSSVVANHIPTTINCDSTYTIKDMSSVKNDKFLIKDDLSNIGNQFSVTPSAANLHSTYTLRDLLLSKNEIPTSIENRLPSSSSALICDSTYTIKDMPSIISNENSNTENGHGSLEVNKNRDVITANKKMTSLPNLGAIDKTGRINAPIITRKHHSNQHGQQSNQQKPGNNSLLRSKSSSNLHFAGEPPSTYRRGQLPKYLKMRKAETQRRLEAAAAIDPLCPPGHSPVPDHERRNTLHLLKKAQADVMRQLSSLPVAQDTLRVRKLKSDLETKLSQIEDGIGIFSQPKVYVLNDDE